MSKKQRAIKIQQLLNEYIPEPAIPLDHTDPYTLLIATLLSAQTTDSAVNKVTKNLFKKASTPEKMAKLDVLEILTIIQTLGLAPTKAKAIKKLSEILVEKYDSKVPESFEELEELPGVGHKTASVVMAQAFHHPAFPVDTHIFRCAHRWKLSNGKNVSGVEADLKKTFPKDQWIRLHLQIILFARKYCQAKKHDPSLCPICSLIK